MEILNISVLPSKSKKVYTFSRINDSSTVTLINFAKRPEVNTVKQFLCINYIDH